MKNLLYLPTYSIGGLDIMILEVRGYFMPCTRYLLRRYYLYRFDTNIHLLKACCLHLIKFIWYHLLQASPWADKCFQNVILRQHCFSEEKRRLNCPLSPAAKRNFSFRPRLEKPTPLILIRKENLHNFSCNPRKLTSDN